ncbi:IS231-related transposase [Bacillus cereus ATCC 10987]|uniref:IS231-related transposase n=1 Tax=Bacillus cereus (strain ATCC 10987 / NRS 248) TaxID=222523 RepID=Q737L2_BACC1|nr:IS231-related transposase [Bacillus cereus ATCC 10987]AIE79601.1 IS231-like protein transposase [Bacillus cereus]
MPSALENVYPGSGGCAQTAGIKIQLEYDLHSGEFLNFQVGPGKNNDKTFGTECLDTLRPEDLCIRDLGYFSLEDLDQMDQRGTYYISRLKLNTNVYMKNSNPEYFKNSAIKKQSEYIHIDMKQILKQLQLYLEVCTPEMNASFINIVYFHPLFFVLIFSIGTFLLVL